MGYQNCRHSGTEGPTRPILNFYFLSIHKDAHTSEAVFPPRRDTAVRFNFNFLLSSYCSIFNALDLAFDRHCTSPTSCVETFPSSQCPLLDQLPFGIRCSLSLHCYAFTACRIPQDLEEPRRLNQYPEAKGGHPFGILKTS
jgi:hypothetical protein